MAALAVGVRGPAVTASRRELTPLDRGFLLSVLVFGTTSWLVVASLFHAMARAANAERRAMARAKRGEG
ncbi:hypothetical protein [Aureimonas mangrovi]|uniref:hypothetical protein n=1 Tax=Aureimonas mangrovi TaxID=2758041 RepID=UPI00163D54AE|nr:hypothetical protein [Aureimonas mangrovi]